MGTQDNRLAQRARTKAKAEKIKAENFNEFAQRAGFVSNPHAVQRKYLPSNFLDTSGAEADRIWNSGARNRFEPVAMTTSEIKQANDLSELHKQLQNMSKVDTSVKTPEGKTRVWNANGDSYLIDSGNRAQLIEARNKQYNPGNIAAMGSDFKNNQSVVTSVNPVTQQPNAWVKKPVSFQEWQDLNKIARNPDYEVGVTAPEGPDMARTGPPTHPVTGLRIEKGDNWNSYTDAPSGVTLHNSNFNWNNKGFKTPTGNVDGLSQQEIDVLYGRPPSPVEPKQQDIDFSGIANWWRKNVGK